MLEQVRFCKQKLGFVARPTVATPTVTLAARISGRDRRPFGPTALGNMLAYGPLMAIDDSDREEIDRLVKALADPISLRATSPSPAVAPHAEASAPATDRGALTPGQRWTTARLLMPAARTEPRRVFAFASAISLPPLPMISVRALTEMPPDVLSARVFVGLGALLSAAMPYWPYANAWSWGLVLYLSAVVLVLITGIWGAKLTWDARLPAAHTVAVGIVLWGFGLIAAEAVPRIGYA